MIELQDIITAAEEELATMGTSGDHSVSPAGCHPSEGEELPSHGGLFLVEVKARGDEVEVFIDSDGTTADGKPRRVTVDDCVALTKAIESRFDRDAEDFSLTVSSAGIGQSLRVVRQYRKLIGRQVEVVLAGGVKIVGTLEGVEAGEITTPSAGKPAATPQQEGDHHPIPAQEGESTTHITLSYPEKQKVEGQKRPQIVTVTRTFPLAEVKTTKEHIDFK